MHSDDHDALVQIIYAGTCDDTAFQHALRTLATAYGCGSAALVYTDRALPGTDIAITYGPFSDPEVRTRYFAYASDDPAPRAMARLPVGQAAATNRLFTPEFLSRSRFLHEFYRPLGFEEALGGPAVSQDGRTGIVAVHRGPDRAPFDDEEIAAFGRLLLHFGQALTLRRTFFNLAERETALSAALEATAQGVLVIDAQSRLKHANARARTMLARNDGFKLTRVGQVRLGDAEAERQLFAALASPTGSRPTVLQVRRDAGRPYLVRLVHAGGSAADGPLRLFSVFVSDPEAETPAANSIIGMALGLSSQASALVASLLRGADLAAHAAQAGISRNTAKFHLEAAFTATGTSRQVDLVRVVQGILRDLGHSPSGG